MKLIACYIDNFGKFSNAHFSFDGGLTEILQENGEGKTTLAAFLRAMLYGMPTDGKNSKDYGDRPKYNPFQGGKYGGTLDVEWQGKRYKILRTFDQKTETKDSYSVLDERGKPCSDLGEVPGFTMFGLSRKGFERTAYITWEKETIDLKEGIGERLCGLVADSSVGYDKAKKLLEDKLKSYQSINRKTVNGLLVYTGFIPETEEKIRQKQAEIYETEALESSLLSVREAYAAAQADMQKTSATLEEMRSAELRCNQWETYQGMLSTAQESKAKADAYVAKYPQGFPDKETVKGLKDAVQKRTKARVRLENRAFPKQVELQAKEEQFASGIPSREKLENIGLLADKYYASVNATIPAATAQKPKKKGVWLGLTVLAAAFAAVGAVLLGSLPSVGAILLALGVVGAAIGASGLMRAPAPVAQVAPAYSQEQYALAERLRASFEEYGIRNTDYNAALRELKEGMKTLQALRAEKEKYEQETAELKADEAKYSSAVAAVFQQYCLTEETYEDAANAAAAYSEYLEDWRLKSAKAEDYRQKNGVTDEPQVGGDIESAKAAFALAQSRVKEYGDKMQELEGRLALLPKLKNELTELREKLQGYTEERFLVDTAIQSLLAADSQLKDTYLTPMQTSFVRFAKAMGAEWVDDVLLDENLQVKLEQKGQPYRVEHLSDGQRALAALCLRLALLENMYEGEMPFCILDDPFVHLDAKHLHEVQRGLNALAEKMQIVYFTCHNSRSMLGE